jgi:hypothetical protein
MAQRSREKRSDTPRSSVLTGTCDRNRAWIRLNQAELLFPACGLRF